jgi:hypothetical protein
MTSSKRERIAGVDCESCGGEGEEEMKCLKCGGTGGCCCQPPEYAPAGLPTPSDVKRLEDYATELEATVAGGGTFFAPRDCAGFAAALRRVTRLAVEARQDRPSDGGQSQRETSPETLRLRDAISDLCTFIGLANNEIAHPPVEARDVQRARTFLTDARMYADSVLREAEQERGSPASRQGIQPAARSERPTKDAPPALGEDVTDEEIDAALDVWFPQGRYVVVEPVYRQFMRDILVGFLNGRRQRSGRGASVVDESAIEEVELLRGTMVRIAKLIGVDHPMQLIAASENNEENYADILVKLLEKRLASPVPPSPAPAPGVEEAARALAKAIERVGDWDHRTETGAALEYLYAVLERRTLVSGQDRNDTEANNA